MQFPLRQNLNNKNPTKGETYHQAFKKLRERENLEREIWSTETGMQFVREIMVMLISLFESFITTVNSVIAEHAPLKKISVKERKLRAKPWITKGILTSINTKTKHIKSIAEQKNKLEEMSCTTYLKNIEIQLIR